MFTLLEVDFQIQHSHVLLVRPIQMFFCLPDGKVLGVVDVDWCAVGENLNVSA